jgi:hypothetical protein
VRLALSLAIILLCFLRRIRRGLTLAGWCQFDACTSCFRQPDRNGLLGGCCSVLAFTDVMHLFADEFSGLSAWSFSFASVFVRTLNRFFFRHEALLTGAASLLTIPCSIACASKCIRDFLYGAGVFAVERRSAEPAQCISPPGDSLHQARHCTVVACNYHPFGMLCRFPPGSSWAAR